MVILSTRMIKLNKKDEKMEDKHDEIDTYITSQGLPFGDWKLIKW